MIKRPAPPAECTSCKTALAGTWELVKDASKDVASIALKCYFDSDGREGVVLPYCSGCYSNRQLPSTQRSLSVIPEAQKDLQKTAENILLGRRKTAQDDTPLSLLSEEAESQLRQFDIQIELLQTNFLAGTDLCFDFLAVRNEATQALEEFVKELVKKGNSSAVDGLKSIMKQKTEQIERISKERESSIANLLAAGLEWDQTSSEQRDKPFLEFVKKLELKIFTAKKFINAIQQSNQTQAVIGDDDDCDFFG